MKKGILSLLFIFSTFSSFSKDKENKHWIKGMYLQWGYNTEWYTKSNIHFNLSNGDNFTVHNAKAHDRPDMQAIINSATDITIPQYNYRIGFYLNSKKTKAIEINFDHAKYIVTDGQSVRVTGTIDGKEVDDFKTMEPITFMHYEHTDGANWFHFNYVSLNTLYAAPKSKRSIIYYLWKAGAGVNVPRTDFTYLGDRLNNKFHLAGYNFGVEGGLRYYPFKGVFIEGTGKTGYVRYIDALADTKTMKGNRASQGFSYFELIATVGFDIKF